MNWVASREHEFIQNFKILQTGFKNAQISKHIPVQELSKAKLLDNLTFAQWFKGYIDSNVLFPGEYKAEKQRSKKSQKINFQDFASMTSVLLIKGLNMVSRGSV